MSYRGLSKVLRPAFVGKQPGFARMSTNKMRNPDPGDCTPTETFSESQILEKENDRHKQTTSDTDMPFIVGHDKKKKEFYINIEDGGKRRNDSAILQYEWIRPNFVDLYHTEVPPVYRGQGIAKLLAKAALEHFVTEDVKMKLSCTYLQKYVLDTRIPRIWNNVVWDD